MSLFMEFILWAVMFGILMFFLGILGIVSFFWNNKFKIIGTVIAAVVGYFFIKKWRSEK